MVYTGTSLFLSFSVSLVHCFTGFGYTGGGTMVDSTGASAQAN